jgi:ribosomal protein S18 acetylase RimI-like enzyme
MTNTPDLRPFAPGDIEGALALWRATEGVGYGPGDTPAALARFLARNPGLSQVAVAGGDVVAALLCGHDGRRGLLYRLAVRDDLRRRGIARALVERALDGLRTEGIERCLLFVLGENEPAARFWESLGGERRNELGMFSISL